MAKGKNKRRNRQHYDDYSEISDRKSRRDRRRLENFEEDYIVPRIKAKSSKPLEAKNEAQGQLIASIKSRDITFVTGPAGTGKTYISAALAAEQLSSNQIEQLIIIRPMQECGEEMGFLPGELQDKYEPWIEPVIDVLNERLGKSHVENLRKSQRIVAKPLQYMRGKSFKDCWIIMDESQNVTADQMKMFLTRIGENSKMIIDGDINQTDLKGYKGVTIESGLARAVKSLKGIPQIGFVEFTEDDIVRHGIIKEILKRF